MAAKRAQFAASGSLHQYEYVQSRASNITTLAKKNRNYASAAIQFLFSHIFWIQYRCQYEKPFTLYSRVFAHKNRLWGRGLVTLPSLELYSINLLDTFNKFEAHECYNSTFVLDSLYSGILKNHGTKKKYSSNNYFLINLSLILPYILFPTQHRTCFRMD